MKISIGMIFDRLEYNERKKKASSDCNHSGQKAQNSQSKKSK